MFIHLQNKISKEASIYLVSSISNYNTDNYQQNLCSESVATLVTCQIM